MEQQYNLKLYSQSKQIERLKSHSCFECNTDFYEDKLYQYLLYKLHGTFSERVMAIKHPKVVEKQENCIIYCANKFQVYKCQYGTFHLLRFGKKLPMVQESLRLAIEAHGKYHRDGNLMYSYLQGKYPDVILYYIRDFIFQFPSFCNQCSSTISLQQKNRLPQQISRIWSHLINKPSRQGTPKKLGQNIQTNSIKCLDCSTQGAICQNDQYQSAYLICLFILEEAKYPLVKYNQQVTQIISTIKKIVMEMQVRRCSKGTAHIWYAPPKNNTHIQDFNTLDNKAILNKRMNWQRVLMKKQAQVVSSMIHHWPQANQTSKWSNYADDSYHMNISAMKSLIAKFTEIYPYNVLAAMKNTLAKCHICNKDKRIKQLQRPVIIFDEEQMKTFMLKQQQAKRKYLVELKNKKQESKIIKRSENTRIEYDGQTNNDSSVPIKIPPQQYEPDDEKNQHTPQVKQMLQKFENYPQIIDFLNNDLIWNQESGPPPQMYEFQEQIFTHDGLMFIKKYGYDRMRRVIVVISKKMREMYQLYGDCVCVDYIPSLIKRRSPAGWHFTIGIFTGQDSNMQNILFGICFLSQDLMIYHKKSLQYFFEGMNFKMSETLITSNQKAICQAVDLLQSQNVIYTKFKHRVSWFYVVQHLKSLLAGQLDQQAMLELYCKSIGEKNRLIFNQLLQVMTCRMVQRPILQQFAKKSKKYCLSCLQNPCFIGYNLSTNRVIQIYQLIEKTFTYQGRVAKFFYYVFKLQKQLCENSQNYKTKQNLKNLLLFQESLTIKQSVSQQIPYSQCFQQLYQLAHVIQEKPYKLLLSTYQDSIQNVTIQQQQQIINQNQPTDNPVFSVIQFRKDIDINFRYKLVYSLKSDCWECSCNWIYLTGLPCHHIIKVITHFNGSLMYYINSRWLIGNQYNQLTQLRGKNTENE